MLATLTLPETLPAPVGAKTTSSVTDCLGVKIVLALRPLVLKPAPVGTTLAIVAFEFPLLVKVTLNVLLLPSFTFPKLKLVGLAASR